MKKELYLEYLDRILSYAIRVTEERGYALPDNEKDEKDQGWLVLAGVVRGIEAGWSLNGRDLLGAVVKWTRAVADVDDKRSAWSTFALLFSLDLTGGKSGNFYQAFSVEEKNVFDRFVCQIDMSYLRAASKNYNVAAGFINTLLLRHGYITEEAVKVRPEDDIQTMLDGYIGDGFFNDDDVRGSGADSRVDGYSAEIIGLLMHYDEICGWNSKFHLEIFEIMKDFARANIYFIDADGEYAKWGRSLRGGSDVKKAFVWEFAQKHGLVDRGVGDVACRKMCDFFKSIGIDEDGRVFKDKAANKGVWDEYTTSIQALGYAAYGLAMALRFCDDSEKEKVSLPAAKADFIKYFPASGFIVGNSAECGVHYIVPLKNRLTKLMFLWHNRITGENDVSVDMSAKFMPLPYFGHKMPAPYSTQKYPFLPVLKTNGETLYPKNVLDWGGKAVETENGFQVDYVFAYCRDMSFEPLPEYELKLSAVYRSDGIDFHAVLPEGGDSFCLNFYQGDGVVEINKSVAIRKRDCSVFIDFAGAEVEFTHAVAEPSIYGPVNAVVAKFNLEQNREIKYSISWRRDND